MVVYLSGGRFWLCGSVLVFIGFTMTLISYRTVFYFFFKSQKICRKRRNFKLGLRSPHSLPPSPQSSPPNKKKGGHFRRFGWHHDTHRCSISLHEASTTSKRIIQVKNAETSHVFFPKPRNNEERPREREEQSKRKIMHKGGKEGGKTKRKVALYKLICVI